MSTTTTPEAAQERRVLNGPAVRAIRQLRGISLRVLAEQAGITAGYLSKIEQGRQQPRDEVADAIAAALDLDVTEVTHVVRTHPTHEVVRAFGRPVEFWNGPRLERVAYRAVVVLDDGAEVECDHEAGHTRNGVRECAFRLIDHLKAEGVAS